MSTKIVTIQREYIKNHYDNLLEAFNPINACDTTYTTLGEPIKMRVLAVIGFDNVDAMSDSAEVVFTNKRGMLVKMGLVLFTFGKYGVATCALPTELNLSLFAITESQI